jgi:hypothetical protein
MNLSKINEESVHSQITLRTDKPKTKGKKNLIFNKADFDGKANRLLNVISSVTSSNVTLVVSNKKAESKEGPLSSKRSSYIGVSLNGPNWQALVTIMKRKTYIGSYKTQHQAAIAFDFYSLLLHSLAAKTNFSYTKEDIYNMLYNFRQNGNALKPEELE